MEIDADYELQIVDTFWIELDWIKLDKIRIEIEMRNQNRNSD